jgi:poly(3-hydroxybutyrate) depolymerase
VFNLVMRGQRDFVSALETAAATRITSRQVGVTGRHELRELLIEDHNGSLRAALRIPLAPAHPAAALVIVGGLRTGRAALDLVDSDLPCAVAAIDYACEVPRNVGGWDVLRLPGLQRDLLRTAVALRDLVAHVRADARIDAERVFIVGASLGVPFASAVAAAVAPSGLVLLHGFADHAALVEHRLRGSVHAPQLRGVLARTAALLTEGLDVRRTLPRLSNIPVLVVESADDEMVPAACRAMLWDATPEPRQRVVLPGGHLRGGQRSEALRAAMTYTRGWLAQRGVPELAL